MADIEMPQLGETVTEGTITRWFKQVGDTIAQDEVLFEVSTDKVDTEVPSPVSWHAGRDPRRRGRHGGGRNRAGGLERRRRGRRPGCCTGAPNPLRPQLLRRNRRGPGSRSRAGPGCTWPQSPNRHRR